MTELRLRHWVIFTLLVLVLAVPVVAQAQTPSTQVHVVVRGDTLSAIAQLYGVTTRDIADVNGLRDISHIWVGQRLRIPVHEDTAPAAAPAGPRPSEHTVQRGEYLSMIAARYGVSTADLAAANSLANPRLIHAGVVLRIPQPGETFAPPPTPEPTPDAAPAAEATPAPEREAAPAPAMVPIDGLPAPTTYVVQPGDTLSRIAFRYQVTTDSLVQLNQISNPSLIHSGLVLNLPEGATAAIAADAIPAPTVTDGKQIIVVLSQQKVYAYENGALLREYLVSTGLPRTPTVQGDFSILWKVRSQLMDGEDYYLPNVEWVSYFYQDYAIHGTYWHENFGRPMSHGCVNMRNEDAQFIYEWAPIGTSVKVIN